MRSFAEAWPEPEILQQLIAKLPWGHNVRLLELVNDREERIWYARAWRSKTAGAGTLWLSTSRVVSIGGGQSNDEFSEHTAGTVIRSGAADFKRPLQL